MDASSRIVVVLPAPSGPTRPKISPGDTLKVIRSTAVTPPNDRVSPSARIAAGDSGLATRSPARTRRLPEQSLGIGRHARLELKRRVRDVDLDPVDELHALLLSLHVLRRELRFRRE